MAVRIRDYFRNIVTGAGISGKTVSLKKHVDDTEIASTTTGSDGSFTLTDSDFTYGGPTYLEINDGTRYKYHSGRVTGQVGPLWMDDLLRSLDQLGVGVVHGLAVTAAGGSMNCSVTAGAAILKDGIPYAPSAAQSVTITTADATNPRIDSIVIRGTRRGETEEGARSLVVVAGTPAGSPTAPALTQTSATWDIWLADVLVEAGVTVIASNKITDRRTFSAHLTPPVGSSGDVLTVESGKWVPKSSALTVVVQEGDVTVDAAVTTLDFDASDFNITSDTGEANIALAYGTGAGTPAEGNHTHSGVYAPVSHTHSLSAVTDVTASAAELNYVDGVTSAIQTQLDAKFAKTGGAIGGAVSIGASLTTSGHTTLGTAGGVVTTSWRLHFSGDVFSVAVGAAAGTGGSVAASRLRGSDQAGELQVVTGASGQSAGTLATVTFGAARPDTNYLVIFQPTSINASDLNLQLSGRATGTFDVRANVAPGAGETLNIGFIVIEMDAP